MKLLTLILLLFASVSYGQMTTIGAWNAYTYSPNKKAPILIAFHGNGEAGGAANLIKNGLPQLLSTGWKPLKEVFIICPQSASGSFPAKEIPQLLRLIKAKYPLADTNQVYLTGYSAGGLTVMEGLIYKPKLALPMSAAGGGNTLVNFIAQNKIPIVHWTGANEADNIGWTLYQVNQKVPGLTQTIKRDGIGHCCWNDVYKSAAFWDLIKVEPSNIPVNAGADQTIMLTDTLKLKGEASGAFKWEVMEKGVYTLINSTSLNAAVKFMASGTYTIRLTSSYGYDEMKVTVNAPKPPEVKEVTSIYINGVTYSLLDNGTVKRSTGKWTGASQVYIKFPCGDRWIEIDNRGMWKLK